MKVIVIGGVAAGTKTAARLKRLMQDAEVTLVTKSRDISYAGCALPYYVGGVVEDSAQLTVMKPAAYMAATGAAVLTEREAVSVDADARTVTTRNVRTGDTETYAYDKLVAATGASAILPKVPGVDLPGVFVLRTPEDAIGMREALRGGDKKRAVVVGGGAIGVEIAENLAAAGMQVTIVEMAGQILPMFDFEMADYLTRDLKKRGIDVRTGVRVTAVNGDTHVTGVATDAGELAAGLVVMAAGIRPNTAFLQNTGVEMAKNGALLVSDSLETSRPGIYAAGDCAMMKNAVTRDAQYAPMGSSANYEGRVLAGVLAGRAQTFPGVLGTCVLKTGTLNAARTGLGEAAAKAAGYAVETVLTVTEDKPAYYPGSSLLFLKLIADRATRRILGAQAIGAGAVDKMADIAAMAITGGVTTDAAENLDFAYAPPFSTAIHPFALAAQMLDNKLAGDMQSITPAEFLRGGIQDYRLIDANATPSIPNATHIRFEDVNGPVAGVSPEEKLLLVCRRGRRAYFLQRRLMQAGYANTYVLEGSVVFNQLPSVAGKTTVPAEEITRVKALGFLLNKGTNNFSGRVITRNGKITAAESRAVTEAAAKYGNGNITMTTRLTLEVQGIPFEKIDAFRAELAASGLETGGTGSKVRPVVSCKGTTCHYGLIDTFALSEEIHERFFHGYAGVKLPHKFKIAVGGCPNNCVKPDLNDLGIIGQRVPVLDAERCRGCKKCQVEAACPIHANGVREGKLVIDAAACNHCGRCVGKCPFHALDTGVDGYKICIGGRWGKFVGQGKALHKVFTGKEEVLAVVEKAILLFREQGVTGERFSDTIARIGFENVEAQLLSDEILARKEAILGAQMHLKGGATC